MIAMDVDRSQGFQVLVADRGFRWTGTLDERWLGILVGALSADPYTWEELCHAISRFAQGYELPQDLGLSRERAAPDAPADGVEVDQLDCLIDLPGRMLVTLWDQTDHPIPASAFDGDLRNERVIDYSLGPDWEVTTDFDAWGRSVVVRRAEQRARWSEDFRTTLYGVTLLEFIIQRAEPWTGRLNQIDTTAGGSPNGADWRDACAAAVRSMYEQWLEHRPDALRGRSVRDILQADQDHLAFDILCRELQWTRFGKPPCELRETDTAYRFAGVGPHEAILYDVLFNHLASAYLARGESLGNGQHTLAGRIDWLRKIRDEWLRSPNVEQLMGKSPFEVIDQERRRRPLVVESADHLWDADCPLCRMMAAPEFAPIFCRLDSYIHDLSALRTGETDEDGQSFDESSWAENSSDETDRATPPPEDAPVSSIWKRVGIFPSEKKPPAVVELFTIAACAAELIEDLKERSADRELIDALIRHVSNLSASLRQDGAELVGPVVSRFCECLDEVEQAHSDLTEKIDDLQPRLLGLVAE